MSSDREHLEHVKKQIHDIQNKHQSKLTFGYFGHAAEPDRKEGDVWEDAHGTKWTRKNGTIQNITKFDDIRVPWFCPQCKNIMNQRFDSKFWRLRGKCTNCVVHEETEMRRLGTWEAYENEKLRANYIDYLKDAIAEMTDLYNTIKKPEFINADDKNILMMETWDVDLTTIKADIQKEIDVLTDVLARVERGEDNE